MEKRIRELIRDQLGLSEITNDTPVLNHSLIEPWIGIEIVMRLEEELDITIADEEAEALVTVGDIIEFIKTKKPELFETPKEELKVVKLKVLKPLILKCQSCEKDFDYNKQEKSSLGTVECPNCKTTLDEKGKILKEKETKEEK